MRRVLTFLAAAVLAASALRVPPALAHPHAWIDLRSAVNFDAEGRVASLTVEWLFDDFYTEFILEDIKRDGAETDQALRAIARENLDGLRAYDYFTAVHVDDERRDLQAVESFETGVRQGRLWMRFELRLAEPADPRRRELRYSIYDPSYYIEMLHLDSEVIVMNGETGAGCLAVIIPPDPSPETIANAAALDRMQRGPESLGEAFAEIVAVSCD